jgi:murein DD-endopeptidase MepM/ murein hydrolase activator NlpD
MSRFAVTLLIAALLLAAAGATLAMAGGNSAREQKRGAAAVPTAGGGDVVDLSAAADDKTSERDARQRPQEDVGDQDLAALERDIKARSKKVLGASPDDGIAPGAPSDKQVREALRQMREGGDAGPIRRGSGDFIWPINGQFTSPFGQRWGRLHAGIDVAAPTGRPIRAAASGRVILAAPTGGYGNYTCIAHNSSISTCYAHQSRFGARAGESVRQGDVIGYVGNTGNSFGAHLHFEVRIGGRPVDPMGYL